MKTKVAMVLSLAGVLVAGSAAALVNTQVLGNSTSASPLVVDGGQQPVPTVTVAISPTTLPVAATPVAPTQAASSAAATQAIYSVGDSGTVTLDTAGDVLTIVAVTPAAGWVVTESEHQDSTNVEVKFQAGTTEVEFNANLLFGVVSPAVETHDLAATNNSVDDNGGGNGGDSGRHGGDDSDDDHGGDDD